MEEVQKDLCSGILRGTLWTRSSPFDTEREYQKNNKLVWDETNRIMDDLFDNVWGDKSEVVVDHFLEITLSVRSFAHNLLMSQHLHQIALFAISAAGSL